MKQLKLVCEHGGARLDVWLADSVQDFTRTFLQKLIKGGNVTVNSKKVAASYKLKVGDTVCISVPEPQNLNVVPEKMEIVVLYEDDDILVVNKPKGMVVHPATSNYSGTLVNALMWHCKDNMSDINGVLRPGIVHRLDKYTSGVLVVAKTNSAHQSLSKLFKEHDIKRVYLGIVSGNIKEAEGTIDIPLGRDISNRKKMSANAVKTRRAVTHFRVLERFKNATYVEVTLETGRTHQIRAHMHHIGHSIVGDPLYQGKHAYNPTNMVGQALCAVTLGFVHPIKGEYMEFNVEPAEDFLELLERLRTSDYEF